MQLRRLPIGVHLPNPLITLNCPNCGGTLVSAGADRYVCSYCGSEHRLRDHPDWLQSLQENLDHLKTQLSDVQSNSRVAAAAQQLPGLLISLRQLTQTLQAWARAAFVSLLVLGVGYFLNRHLIFEPGAGWIRFMPPGIMALGGLSIGYILVRSTLEFRKRAHILQQIERCRNIIRTMGAGA